MSGVNSRFKETFQSDWIMPPTVGGIVALAVTSTEVDIDLTTVPGHPDMPGTIGSDGYNPNPIGHYVSLTADGCDVYVAFGPSVGGSTGLGHLTTSQNATVATNAVTVSNNDTFKIPNGVTVYFKLPGETRGNDSADVGSKSKCRYLGYLSASGASGNLRIYQSSP